MNKVFFGELPKNLKSVAVIMAGGSGTRFWPLSRSDRPKQFLALGEGRESLIKATARRLEPLTSNKGILVVTAANQREMVQAELPDATVIAEPCAKNTAPCVAIAAKYILDNVGDIPMLCLPADHLIKGEKQLLSLFEEAIGIVKKSKSLVTIGISPTKPETGYGYIRKQVEEPISGNAFRVKEFKEKPSLETAKAYLKSGEYYWNSGMFVWLPSTILEEFSKYLPDVSAKLSAHSFADVSVSAEVEKIYPMLNAVSIDVGILERSNKVVMIAEQGIGWSDVGSWSAWLEEAQLRTGEQTVVLGDVTTVNCKNVGIIGDQRFIAAIGLEDVVIVDTKDALLVCHKDKAQEVKEVVEQLKRSKRDVLL